MPTKSKLTAALSFFLVNVIQGVVAFSMLLRLPQSESGKGAYCGIFVDASAHACQLCSWDPDFYFLFHFPVRENERSIRTEKTSTGRENGSRAMTCF